MRQSGSKKLAKAKCDKYFSEWVRRSNAKNDLCTCITCGQMYHWTRIHCGHFMSRRYESTRYDEKNCAPQCVSCNTFNQGRQYEFGKAIDQKYGAGTADSLEQKSKMLCKRTKSDYEWIAICYKEKLKSI